ADEVVIVPRGVAVEKIDDHPLVKRVKEVTDGKGVDAVFDGVGKDAFEASLASLGVGAALIQYGVVSGPSPLLDTMRLSAKINSVQFHTVAHDMTRPGGYEELTGALYKHLQSGLLKVPIYPSYKLEEIAEAHAAVESGTAHGKNGDYSRNNGSECGNKGSNVIDLQDIVGLIERVKASEIGLHQGFFNIADNLKTSPLC
ncbi:hypothetical protein GQ42DRAFT_171440, partial [Ramicandelaber brevisporus]